MSTTLGVTVSLVVLAAAGLLPTWSLVGTRWLVVPLSVLAGTVVSAVAATCFLALGGSLMGWFLGLALLGALVSLLRLGARSSRTGTPGNPIDGPGPETAPPPGERVFRATAAAALVAVGIWCLRGLVTPMVGLDTRLFWFLRAGWWLWPHGQALADMHNIGADTHAGYPPLVSSTVAVGWWVSGTHSDRIGAVLIAIVNVCAAVAAAWALVELGSLLSARIRTGGAGSGPAGRSTGARPPNRWMALDQLPRWCGAGAAVLLVLTFFGVTSVFAFNGYADPLWSVAAVGAVAYLLVLPVSGAGIGAAAILLAVAGETKVEGTATAIAIIAIVGVRAVLHSRGTAPLRTRVVVPILVVAGAAVALVVWPAVMRLRHVGADLNTSGPRQSPLGRGPGPPTTPWPRTCMSWCWPWCCRWPVGSSSAVSARWSTPMRTGGRGPPWWWEWSSWPAPMSSGRGASTSSICGCRPRPTGCPTSLPSVPGGSWPPPR